MNNKNYRAPGLQYLDAFVGKWQTAGKIKAGSVGQELTLRGTDTYEWLPGGFFLLHKVDVSMGEEHTESLEIIGFDMLTNTYPMQSFDNRGNMATLHASVKDGTWVFLSDSLRFAGSFSKDGRTLTGSWEKSEDGIK